MWRSGYDMTPEQFAALTEKIWQEVKPLYDALHCYTRTKLNEKYGDAVQPKTGPIRADLLGNMWAQEWGNIYPLVAPAGSGDLGYDIGALLEAKGYDPLRMVHTGENFYSSLGFAPLPATFWTRSQITKPRDRDVVCHASAWDIDNKDDVRIKMCTKVNSDDFVTIHHELGHNYYQRAYSKQPYLYLNGANDGFHEAIGDFIALSITPQYLVDIKLLDPAKVPSAGKGHRPAAAPGDGQGRVPAVRPAHRPLALGRVRRLDQAGRLQQGVDADAAAISGHRAASGSPGRRLRSGRQISHPRQHALYALFPRAGAAVPVLRGGVQAGGLDRAAAPLLLLRQQGSRHEAECDAELGASKPWPDALQAFTGSREMSGKALIAYFAPLKKWLDAQNKGKVCGW